jgi:hypothetical protein
MGSTIRSLAKQDEAESPASATIRWRSWPLVADLRWSWVLPVGILCLGALVWWHDGGWLLGLVAATALALTMWQYLLPVTYEISSLGVRRYAWGRMRLVPWSAIRAYQLRSTGVILFQRGEPTAIDLVRSLFVPYPRDADEVVVAIRLYLPHAVEMP